MSSQPSDDDLTSNEILTPVVPNPVKLNSKYEQVVLGGPYNLENLVAITVVNDGLFNLLNVEFLNLHRDKLTIYADVPCDGCLNARSFWRHLADLIRDELSRFHCNAHLRRLIMSKLVERFNVVLVKDGPLLASNGDQQDVMRMVPIADRQSTVKLHDE